MRKCPLLTASQLSCGTTLYRPQSYGTVPLCSACIQRATETAPGQAELDHLATGSHTSALVVAMLVYGRSIWGLRVSIHAFIKLKTFCSSLYDVPVANVVLNSHIRYQSSRKHHKLASYGRGAHGAGPCLDTASGPSARPCSPCAQWPAS